MSTVRSEKEAVVAEIRAKMSGASAVIITEYRGISVTGLATLRLALREHGAEYRVYKNTLARFAAREAGIEGLDALLVGPTAITFVDGDVAAVAKTLKDFSKTNQNLVLQGGAIDGKTVSASYIDVLASLPSQEAMLGQFAGLLLALPRNMAYGLKALIDQKEAA
ncbi:MAG: 50S ribosomal protein L10 [Actinobacteria bacterium]|jgi:large subunit ribosomal protein L10|nr:50S ribosomal protein L10 [Actinomycetota bacterium]